MARFLVKHKLCLLGAILVVIVASWAVALTHASAPQPVAHSLQDQPALGLWEVVPAPITATLRGVSLLPCCDGWLVGDGDDGGVILTLEDGDWQQVPAAEVPTSAKLADVSFAAPDEGWTVGDSSTVLFYGIPDGGDSAAWRTVDGFTDACPAADLRAVQALGNGQAVVAGGNCVALYDGSAWSTMIGDQTSDVSFNNLAASSNATWAVGAQDGQGLIVRVADGSSMQWLVHRPLNALAALDDETVWAVGGDTIYRYDGGTWSAAATYDGYTLYGLAFGTSGPALRGWAVGGRRDTDTGDWTGVVIPYADGAWGGPQLVPGTGRLYAVDAFTADDAWAVGENSLMAHWQAWRVPTPTPTTTPTSTPIPTPTPTPGPPPGQWVAMTLPEMVDVAALSPEEAENAWAVGHLQDGDSTVSHVFRFDGGSWTAVFTTTDTLNDIHMFNCCLGYAVGTSADSSSGVVWRYNGADWTQQATVADPLVAVTGLSVRKVFAVGGNHLYSYLGGGVWEQTLTANDARFVDIEMAPDGSGWAVTRNSSLARYTDGQWEYEVYLAPTHIEGLSASSVSEVWAAGKEIRRFTALDWGGSPVSWGDRQQMGVDLLYDVAVLPGATSGVTGWAVGRGLDGKGIILMAEGDPTWGGNWRPITGAAEWGLLKDVHILSAQSAWAVGDRGLVLHYSGPNYPTPTPVPTDTSVYWAAADQQPPAGALHAVYGRGADDAWFGGAGLWHFDGSGYTSVGRAVPNYVDISFGSDKGWIAQNHPGALLRHDQLDSPITPPGVGRLEALSVVSNRRGLAVGSQPGGVGDSSVARLDDGGAWVAATAPPGPWRDVTLATGGEAWGLAGGQWVYAPAYGADWAQLSGDATNTLALDLLPDGNGGFAVGGDPPYPTQLVFDSVGNDIGDFAGGDTSEMLLGDWDGDGRTDVAGWNSDRNAWDFRLSQGVSNSELTFHPVQNDIGGFAGGDTSIMWLGDWDGDGRTDIAGWNDSANAWDMRLSQGLYTQRWQATDPALHHHIGWQVSGDDWRAGYDGGRDCDSWAAAIYGPYISLAPDTYRATFRLQTSERMIFDFAILDVTYNRGQHTLSSRTLKGTDFKSSNAWQEFHLDFAADSSVDDVELRVRYLNGLEEDWRCWPSPNLTVDWVSLDGTLRFGQVSNNLGNWNAGNWNPMMFGDFDGNGTTDIAGWNPGGNNWDFRLSQGVSGNRLLFQKVGNNLGDWNAGASNAMLFGDFDGDGRGDVASWNPDSRTWDFRLSPGVSDGSLAFHHASNNLGGFAGGNAGVMLVADFDGDSRTDVAGWNSTFNDDQGGWDTRLSQGISNGDLHFKMVSNNLDSLGDGDASRFILGDWEGRRRAGPAAWTGSAWDFHPSDGGKGDHPRAWRFDGETFIPLDLPTNLQNAGRIVSVGSVSCDEFWAGTDHGVLLHYQAGQWDPPIDYLADGEAITAIHINGPEDGWAVTAGGRVLRLARRPGQPPPPPPPPSVKLVAVNGTSFLEEPALDVGFRAEVNWHGHAPGEVRYRLNDGEWVTPTSGRYGASWTLNTGDLPVDQENQLQAEAVTLAGEVSDPDTVLLQVRPCASNLECDKYTATLADGRVDYSGAQDDSGSPKIAGAPTMPGWLPMVGGKPLGIPDQRAGQLGVNQRTIQTGVADASAVQMISYTPWEALGGSPWPDGPVIATRIDNQGMDIFLQLGTNKPDPEGPFRRATQKIDGFTIYPYIKGWMDINTKWASPGWTGKGRIAIGVAAAYKKGITFGYALGPAAGEAVEVACDAVDLDCNVIELVVGPRFEIGVDFDLFPDFSLQKGYGALGVKVEVFLGIRGGPMEFGVYAGGVPTGYVDFYPEFHFRNFQIPLYAGFKIKLWFYENRFEVGYTFCTPSERCPSQMVLTDTDGASAEELVTLARQRGQELWQQAGWEFVPRPDLSYSLAGAPSVSQAAHFGPLVVGQSGSVTETQLVDNAYAYPESVLALGDNDTALVAWVHDDVSQPPGQGLELLSTYFDGSAWQPAVQVTDDSLPDMTPLLAFDSLGQGLAVWQRHASGIIPSTPTITFTHDLEVAYAVFDPATGAWSAAQLLTPQGDERMELPKGLSSSTDGLVAAWWLSGEGGEGEAGIGNVDTASWATWDGTTWSPTRVITSHLGLTDLALDLHTADSGLAAAVINTHEVSGTVGTELFIAPWDGTAWGPWQRLTYDCEADVRPSVFHDQNGQAVVVWVKGGRLVSHRPGVDTFPRPVITADEPGVMGYTGASSPAGHIALLWMAHQLQDGGLDDFLTDTTRHGSWLYNEAGGGTYGVSESRLYQGITGSDAATSQITHTVRLPDDGVVLQARVSGSTLHRYGLELRQGSTRRVWLEFDDDGFKACYNLAGQQCEFLNGATPIADTLYTLRIEANPGNSFVYRVYDTDGAELANWTLDNGPLYSMLDGLRVAVWTDEASDPRSAYATEYVYLGPPDKAPDPAANTGPGYDIYYVTYDVLAGEWSLPRPMTSDFPAELGMAPAFNGDGELKVAYNKQEVVYQTVTVPSGNPTTSALQEGLMETVTISDVVQPGPLDVYAGTHLVAPDLALLSLRGAPANPQPGTTAQLSAEVGNLGDLTTDASYVGFYAVPAEASSRSGADALASALDGTLIGLAYLPDLTAGYTQTVSVNWDVPADLDAPQVVVARVEPPGSAALRGLRWPQGARRFGRAELRTDNNVVTLPMVLPDLELTHFQIVHHDHDTVHAQAMVHNVGATSSAPASLQVWIEGVDPLPLAEVPIPALAPGAHKALHVALALPPGLEAGDYRFHGLVMPQSDELHATALNDLRTEHHRALPDLIFVPERLKATWLGDRSGVRVQVGIRNHGHVASQPAQVEVFTSSPVVAAANGSPLQPILVLDVPALAPGQAVDLESEIAPDVSGYLPEELYFRLDAGHGVEELDESDNLAMRRVRWPRSLPLRIYLPLVVRNLKSQ